MADALLLHPLQASSAGAMAILNSHCPASLLNGTALTFLL